MVDVDAADHGWLVKKWHVRDGPRLSTDLRADLNEDLAADAANVFAAGDRVCQNNLTRHGQILQQKPLQVVIERSFSLCARKNEHNGLHFTVEVAAELALPVREAIRAHGELSRFVHSVRNLVKALLHSFEEHGRRPPILLAEEDTPGEQGRLLQHLGLYLPVQVGALFQVEVSLSHEHFTRDNLVSSQARWLIVDVDLPVLHFSRALLGRSEHFEKRLALLDALLSVGMSGMGHFLH